MIFTPQARRLDPPENAVLLDCKRVVHSARELVLQVGQGKPAPDEIQSVLRDVHSVKGAAGFLDQADLTAGLHELETCLRASPDPSGILDTRDCLLVLHKLEVRLNTVAPDFRTTDTTALPHHLGETLWWSHELTQTTAAQLGKRVFMIVHGGELPVGNEVHDVLQSCLVHLIRNAIVHGIETPAARRAAGKPEIGLITIIGEQTGSQFEVSVTDNGSGLGAFDGEDIFEMGQTSVRHATLYAGQGLGLAAVKERVEGCGGWIETRSSPGKGARFRLILPCM